MEDVLQETAPEEEAAPTSAETEADQPSPEPASPPALADFDNVVKLYGAHQALGPVTLSLPEGAVGLLGPNGAGKTTLVRLLLGLLKPTSGTLKVLGEDVAGNNKALRRRIGYVPEGEAMFPDLNGVEAVAYAGRLMGMRKADALQRAHQVLDYVELGEARYRLVEKFSTGMRQRLKLAQALVHDPDLLILDEPTEGVDPEARIQILDLIAELHKEYRIQTILSTHILTDVERLCTHALVLNEGRVAAHGAIADLKKASTKAYVLRVTGDVAPLLQRLQSRGITYEQVTPSLRINHDDPRELLQIVQESGLVVRHLAPFEFTLEEAFEQAVGVTPVA